MENTVELLIATTVYVALIGTEAFGRDANNKPTAAPRSPIQLKAPEKWSGETITLPPGFARDMAIKGVEVIRFAPGMFDPQAEDFFSYASSSCRSRKAADGKQLHDEFLSTIAVWQRLSRGAEARRRSWNFKLKLTYAREEATCLPGQNSNGLSRSAQDKGSDTAIRDRVDPNRWARRVAAADRRVSTASRARHLETARHDLEVGEVRSSDKYPPPDNPRTVVESTSQSSMNS